MRQGSHALSSDIAEKEALFYKEKRKHADARTAGLGARPTRHAARRAAPQRQKRGSAAMQSGCRCQYFGTCAFIYIYILLPLCMGGGRSFPEGARKRPGRHSLPCPPWSRSRCCPWSRSRCRAPRFARQLVGVHVENPLNACKLR